MSDLKTGFSSFSDSELVEKYKATDDKTFVGELYKRYIHLVLAMCIHFFDDKEEAEDAVLQIFEKLFTDLKHHEVNCFKAWLICVVRNYCLQELKHKENVLGYQMEYHYVINQEDYEQDKEVQENEDEKLKRLEKSLQELSEFQKRCVELYYLRHKSYAQIVETTGYSLKEVKSYLQNGKRKLKLLLQNGLSPSPSPKERGDGA